MKLYYVSYLTAEHGEIEAFLSKAKAQKRHNELKRGTAKHWATCIKNSTYADCQCENVTEMLYDLSETEFPISAEGIRQAFEDGACLVSK